MLNHQHMLQTYPGADGLKTGYIEASGYNWSRPRCAGTCA